VKDVFNRFCFGDTITDANLASFTDREYTFKSWTTEHVGTYTAIVRVTYAEDVNPSNDESTKTFQLTEDTKAQIDRGSAIHWILHSLNEEGFLLSEHSQTHLSTEIVPAGTSLVQTLPKPGPVPYDTLEKLLADAWVAYFNPDKDARYGHPGTVVVVNAEDSALMMYPVRSTVTVGGTELGGPFNTATLVDGTIPQVTTGNTNSITNEVQTANPHDSTIVILVSGDPDNAKEGRGFKQDVEFMDLNLRLERDGPRLPQSSIRKLDNPSPADILGMLDTLKGKYNRIIFFYSGHGDSLQRAGDDDLGWMSTRDSALAYWRLFQGLYETGAKDLEIIIDACHSGTAISDVEYDERYKDRNITLITAASPGRVSYTNYYAPETTDTVGVGAFTFAFVQAFGNPAAESDGAAGTSFVEAFQWTRLFGKDHRGRWLDTLLDPRIYVHKAQTKADTPSSAGTGVSITPAASLSDDDTLRVTFNAGPPEVTNLDTTATYISTGRYWSIDNKGLKADYQFYVSPLWDSVPAGEEPTILHLEENDDSWTAYDSAAYFADSKSIMAYGVDFSAKWAIGVAAEGPVGAVRFTEIQPVSLLAPNPAQRFVALTFTLEESANVTIMLLDAAGRSLSTLHRSRASLGKNTATVELPVVPAGNYFLRVLLGEEEQLLKLQIR
jgi:hypothetical protein